MFRQQMSTLNLCIDEHDYSLPASERIAWMFENPYSLHQLMEGAPVCHAFGHAIADHIAGIYPREALDPSCVQGLLEIG